MFHDDLNVNVSYYLNAIYIAIYIIASEVTFSVSECISCNNTLTALLLHASDEIARF